MAVGLKYIDETDKCYGITGMVVAMMVWENDSMLTSMSLDADDNENIVFSHEFFVEGNPRISPKYTWNKIVEHYKIMMQMLVSNVMCRHCVLHNKPITPQLKQLIYRHLEEEGCNNCSLEKDEVKELFEQYYSSSQRLFSHTGVQQVVNQFASTVQSSHNLSREQILHHLQALNRL